MKYSSSEALICATERIFAPTPRSCSSARVQLFFRNLHAVTVARLRGLRNNRRRVCAAPRQLEQNFHPLRLHPHNLARRANAAQLSSDNHAHAVAQHLRIGQNVRREQHRPPFALQFQNNVAHFPPPYRIEPRHRLIQNHHFRIVQNRLRQTHALQHPLRIFPQLNLPCRLQPDFLEHPRDALASVRGRQIVKPREIIQHLGRRQIIVEIRLLGQIPDVSVHFDVRDRLSQNARRARVGKNRAPPAA